MKNKLNILKFIFSLLLLYYLFQLISLEALLAKISDVNLLILLIGALVLLGQFGLSSIKWKIIISAEKKIPFLFLFKSYLLCGFISLFLPSSFGGDIYRAYSLKKYNLDSFQNISSVLFDRLTGLFALSSISVVSFVTFYGKEIDYKFLFMYLISTSLFWIFSSEKMITILSNLKLKPLKFILKILQSFNQYRTNYSVLLKSLAIAFLFQSNIVFLNKLYCVALGIDIQLSYLFMIIPLVYLTEMLPISINGLGVRESAFVFFFVQAGKSSEEALALSFLVISMRYLVCVIFGGPLFLKTFIFQKQSLFKKKL